MTTTLARVNWGRWIADCPECDDARELDPGQPSIVCAEGHISDVGWPDETFAAQITAALARRPNPRNRNWFPVGHPLAVAHGYEQGQTAAQLDAETDAHETTQAARDAQADQLRTLLGDLGVTINADGSFSGKVLEEGAET